MSYARPSPMAVVATWQGASAYTRPSSAATDATWAPSIVTALALATTPLGAAAIVVEYANAAVLGWAAATTPLGEMAARAQSVLTTRASASSPLGAAAPLGQVPTVARGAAVSPLGYWNGVAQVIRYELRGTVRDQGVLVNRRVRAYHRDTGTLVGEAETVAGAFVIHAGFAPAEHYLIPIDLGADAADYAPPAANRVLSVLAQDAA